MGGRVTGHSASVPEIPRIIVQTVPYHDAKNDAALAAALEEHAATHRLVSVWENDDGTVRAVWERR